MTSSHSNDKQSFLLNSNYTETKETWQTIKRSTSTENIYMKLKIIKQTGRAFQFALFKYIKGVTQRTLRDPKSFSISFTSDVQRIAPKIN